MQAILRRVQFGTKIKGRDNLSVDLEAHMVTQGNEVLELRPTEFVLLVAFLRSPGRVFSRAALLEVCNDPSHETLERTMDVHIRNLRAKLGENHGIETVFGMGYRYALE